MSRKLTALSPSMSLESFGEHIFRGAIAKPYLEAQGLPAATLDTPAWTTNGNADKVAAAVLQWAKERGASVFCHWFQPLGASCVRHGQSAQVQIHMIDFDRDGKPIWDFKGKHLLRGETDGSSYPNGGLRATHKAGAYLTIDATSPIFLRGDVIFIPSCMVSFEGQSIDEKIPLLRSCDSLSLQGSRLLTLLGRTTTKLVAKIGLEQELFLIPRFQFNRRPDLQLAGRTVVGRQPPRGQEMSDHYMAPPSFASPALACMQDIQQECYKVGIPLKTRHREVAPNQYEFAASFGNVSAQVDQNLTVMQIIDEVATRHGLAALFQEKPFQGINGSGKHNNWSLATEDDMNLFNFPEVLSKTGSPLIFVAVLSCVIKALSEHGDLFRLAVTSPGNDFRLGACEAPPAIMSTHLGADLTNYLESFLNSEIGQQIPLYVPNSKILDLGASSLPPIEIPAEDRNRTSPFPYGGHRFEFRAAGSSQNAALVNMILATVLAQAFSEFADFLESDDAVEKYKTGRDIGQARLLAAQEYIQNTLRQHKHVIFNGNGYEVANQTALTERGVWRVDNGIDAICRFSAEKNIKLFEQRKVLSRDEVIARQTVMLDHYTGLVEIEAFCLVDILQQHVLPAVRNAKLFDQNEIGVQLERDVTIIKSALDEISKEDDSESRARKARLLRLETMVNVREHVDFAEGLVPPALWTLATYKELLFLDQQV